MTRTSTFTQTREEYALAIVRDALKAARAVAERLPADHEGAFLSPVQRQEGGPVTGASRENSLLITVLEEAEFRAQQDVDRKIESRDRAERVEALADQGSLL